MEHLTEEFWKKYNIDGFFATNYLNRFRQLKPGKFALIKIGGDVTDNEESFEQVTKSLSSIANLGLYPAIVHGGKKQIEKRLEKECISIRKVNGLRITDDKTLEVVVEELDKITEKLVGSILNNGTKAISLNKERIFEVKKMPCIIDGETGKECDLERVGRVIKINAEPIIYCAEKGIIPVTRCIGYDTNNQPYNINGDTAAKELFYALQPEKCILLTKVGGILDKGELISEATPSKLKELVEKGIAKEGMGYKVKEILEVLEKVDCTIQITSPINLIYELFTEKGRGTYIRRD